MKAIVKTMSVFIVFVTLAACSTKEGAAVFRDSSITYVTGDVTVNGKPADHGQVINGPTVIKTGAASECEIVFNTKNIIHIQENSLFRMDPGSPGPLVELDEGSLAAVVKKLSRTTSDYGFGIATPTVVTGVRGTSYFVKVENDDSTYVCVCNGTIHTEGSDGSEGQDMTAAHHQAVRVSLQNGRYTSVPAALEYHGDSLIEGVAEKIGATIDWTKPDRR